MRQQRRSSGLTRFLGGGITAVVASLGAFALPAAATTVDVATEAEYRQALQDLSADANGPHTVNVTADIVVAGAADPLYSGDEDLTINGNGHTISGGGNSSILDTVGAGDITFTDITLVDGSTALDGGAVTANGDVTIQNSTLHDNSAAFDGGAVFANGDVIIENATFHGNSAGPGGLGGAVAANGNVTIANSTLHDNESGGDDGAAFAGGAMTIVNSALYDNTATNIAGAIGAVGVTTITSSALYGNEAGNLGGAVLGGDQNVIIENSTLHDNTSAVGGGAVAVSLAGNVVLRHATLSGNAAPDGANVHTREGDVESFGSVLADPQGGGENCSIAGGTTSTYSYDTDDSCGFADATDTSGGDDPDLGALADNGGPTLTMLPQPGSPLIDAIPIADCDPAIPTDQRGVERPQGDGCDTGAVEVTEEDVVGPDNGVDEVARPAEPVVREPVFTG
jgi:predicted outer membrane repeat protein